DDRLHAGGTGRADDDFAAVFFPKPQRLFERIGVGLVHLIAAVLFADPRLCVVEPRLPLSRRDLLDANRNFHIATTFTATGLRDAETQRLSCTNKPLRLCVSAARDVKLFFVSLEHQRRIRAAEAEGIRQRITDRHLSTLVWHVVEIA